MAVDVFADGIIMSLASNETNGLVDLTPANRLNRLFEHAGHNIANKLGGYDLALTGNTVGTVTALVTVVAEFAQG